MADSHFHRIELRVSFKDFLRLPQNSAYKYEYFDGRAVLSPRPKCHRAVLDLRPVTDIEPYKIRLLPVDKIMGLDEVFRAAFRRTQPYAALDDAEALKAARECLEKTASGGDGPLIHSACFQAFEKHFNDPAGAILITLMPDDIVDNWRSHTWKEPPPADAVERRLGCPHLTWIFVSPWVERRGMGTALLAASVTALLKLGYSQLASTFLQGNDSSTLWHWHNGFRLQPLHSAWRRELRTQKKE
jgi:hypothetical protein